MVRVGSEVASPVQSTVEIPNREDILVPDCHLLVLLCKDFMVENLEVFSWVGVGSDHFIALLLAELTHELLDDPIGIVIEFLEIVAEVAQDVGLLMQLPQEFVLVAHAVDIRAFGLADWWKNISSVNELLLVSMDGPAKMCGDGSISTAVGGFSLPHPLHLVFLEDMLIRSLH